MTTREIVYMVLDELKSSSDDKYFEEEHVRFLASKYRAFLLKQRYGDVRKEVSNANLQLLCLDLIQVSAFPNEDCEGGMYLRSSKPIPNLITIGTIGDYLKVTSIDYWSGTFDYINRERFRYVGYNRFLRNIIYCTVGPDNHLYMKSNNPQFSYLKRVKVLGPFEDFEDSFKLSCNTEGEPIVCDILDIEFPLEAALVPPLIELILKELLGATYRPKDSSNNDKDDLSDVQTK